MRSRSFQIRIYGELLTGHMYCEPDTALEFLDWVDETGIELWEPSSVDFNGNFARWDTEKRRDSVYRQAAVGGVTLWFLGPPDAALLLKLRWHDHFSDFTP